VRDEGLDLSKNKFKLVVNEGPRVEPATDLLEISHGRRGRLVEFFDRKTIGFEYEEAMPGWRARRMLGL
jgi:hypothetical protein